MFKKTNRWDEKMGCIPKNFLGMEHMGLGKGMAMVPLKVGICPF